MHVAQVLGHPVRAIRGQVQPALFRLVSAGRMVSHQIADDAREAGQLEIEPPV